MPRLSEHTFVSYRLRILESVNDHNKRIGAEWSELRANLDNAARKKMDEELVAWYDQHETAEVAKRVSAGQAFQVMQNLRDEVKWWLGASGGEGA